MEIIGDVIQVRLPRSVTGRIVEISRTDKEREIAKLTDAQLIRLGKAAVSATGDTVASLLKEFGFSVSDITRADVMRTFIVNGDTAFVAGDRVLFGKMALAKEGIKEKKEDGINNPLRLDKELRDLVVARNLEQNSNAGDYKKGMTAKEASELMRIAKDTHPNHLVADRFYDACRLRHGFVSLACTARQMLLLGLAEYDKEVGTPWGEIVKPFDDTPPLRKSNHPLANWDK